MYFLGCVLSGNLRFSGTLQILPETIITTLKLEAAGYVNKYQTKQRQSRELQCKVDWR
jgi:hypothetical protein